MLRIFSLAFSLALTGAIAPGPMLALVIGQVLAQGLPAAVLILLGHALIETVYVFILARGLGRFLANVRVRAGLGLVGGAVLIWMGETILRQAGDASLAASQTTALPWAALILAGIGVSLSNPYFTGWWATVGSGQLATLSLQRRRDYLLFFFGHEAGDALWYLLVALVLTVGRTWLTDGIYQGLLTVCGLIILLLGGLFLFIAVRLLWQRK